MNDSGDQQGKRQRHAYMYTPFGGEQALHSALGENMVRIANNKTPMGLIAPSHEHADALEVTRQQTLSKFSRQMQHSQRQIDVNGVQQRRNDSEFLARIRASVEDPNADADSTRLERGMARADHQFNKGTLDVLRMGAQAQLSMYSTQHDALSKTRILNQSAHLYPDLFPDPPLQFLRPDSKYSGGDKLYVLGHGSPKDATLYAQSDGQGGKLGAKELAQHLKDAGLPQTAMDVRLTACQGVPVLGDEHDGTTPDQATKKSGYLVPELSRAMHGLGFRDLTVTGYQGNGVTFPFNSNSRLRSDPDNQNDRVQRRQAAIRYPVKDMGD